MGPRGQDANIVYENIEITLALESQYSSSCLPSQWPLPQHDYSNAVSGLLTQAHIGGTNNDIPNFQATEKQVMLISLLVGASSTQDPQAHSGSSDKGTDARISGKEPCDGRRRGILF